MNTTTTFPTTNTTNCTTNTGTYNQSMNSSGNGPIPRDNQTYTHLYDDWEGVHLRFKSTNKLLSAEIRFIFSQSDFVLLTETWANDLSDLSVDDFILIQLKRAKKRCNTKRCSGGIALYIRQSFYQNCTIIEKDSDDIIWIKIKDNMLNLNHDLFLCLCCIIPANSSRDGLVEMNVLDRISNYILKIANDTNDCFNLLLCGDFNGRTGNERDHVMFDNDVNIDILPIDYKKDAFIT